MYIKSVEEIRWMLWSQCNTREYLVNSKIVTRMCRLNCVDEHVHTTEREGKDYLMKTPYSILQIRPSAKPTSISLSLGTALKGHFIFFTTLSLPYLMYHWDLSHINRSLLPEYSLTPDWLKWSLSSSNEKFLKQVPYISFFFSFLSW